MAAKGGCKGAARQGTVLYTSELYSLENGLFEMKHAVIKCIRLRVPTESNVPET